MATNWGYVTSPSLNWNGRGTQAVHFTNILPPAPEPKVFSPLELSGCVLWLDANDSSTIQVNQDTSGANVNRVMKWFDKAKPSQQNHYEKDNNPIESGLYNVHTMNGLNTVYFENDCYMLHHDGGVTFSFQDRTFFAVVKPLTDLSGTATPYLSIYNGYEIGDMNTTIALEASGGYSYVMCENQIQCGIRFDLSGTILNQRMIIMFAQSSTDISGNAGTFDTVYQTLTNSSLAASYNTAQSQYYLNDPNKGTSQDIAEIIMYNRVLSIKEQQQVSDYLADKWNASGPGFQWAQGVAEPYPFNPSSAPISIPEPEPEPPKTPPPKTPPLEPFAYTYIIYGIFGDGPPNWYWCDENAQTETPAVLAEAYDGTTALRDGLAVLVSGVFYA